MATIPCIFHVREQKLPRLHVSLKRDMLENERPGLCVISTRSPLKLHAVQNMICEALQSTRRSCVCVCLFNDQ